MKPGQVTRRTAPATSPCLDADSPSRQAKRLSVVFCNGDVVYLNFISIAGKAGISTIYTVPCTYLPINLTCAYTLPAPRARASRVDVPSRPRAPTFPFRALLFTLSSPLAQSTSTITDGSSRGPARASRVARPLPIVDVPSCPLPESPSTIFELNSRFLCVCQSRCPSVACCSLAHFGCSGFLTGPFVLRALPCRSRCGCGVAHRVISSSLPRPTCSRFRTHCTGLVVVASGGVPARTSRSHSILLSRPFVCAAARRTGVCWTAASCRISLTCLLTQHVATRPEYA